MRGLLLGAAALAFALPLGGCSGNSSSSSGLESQATAVPSSASPEEGHHHRRRRHHRESGYASASAAPGTVAAQPAPAGGSWPCNDQQFLTDQQQFANGSLQEDQEVDVCGTVTNVLASQDTRSGVHGYYDLQVAPGTMIEIVCDLGEMDAPAWPWVKTGDYSYVQGRYYYDSTGSQGIDWTHHGTGRSWSSPGYVVVSGTEYQ
jgi:hypothetical protein